MHWIFVVLRIFYEACFKKSWSNCDFIDVDCQVTGFPDVGFNPNELFIYEFLCSSTDLSFDGFLYIRQGPLNGHQFSSITLGGEQFQVWPRTRPVTKILLVRQKSTRYQQKQQFYLQQLENLLGLASRMSWGKSVFKKKLRRLFLTLKLENINQHYLKLMYSKLRKMKKTHSWSRVLNIVQSWVKIFEGAH